MQAEGAIDALFEHAAAPAGSVGDGAAVHGLLSLVGVLIRVVILLAAEPNANPDVGRASDADVSCDARVRAEELAVDADGNDRGGAADVRAFFLGCAPPRPCHVHAFGCAECQSLRPSGPCVQLRLSWQTPCRGRTHRSIGATAQVPCSQESPFRR